MVELHFRDSVTGAVTRAIYNTAEEAQGQAALDTAESLTCVPFLIVTHDPEVEFDPQVQGYNPLVLDQIEVLDADTLNLAAS